MISPLVALALVAAAAGPAVAQSPLRTLPGLTEVAVYEATATVTRNAFAAGAAQLLSRVQVLNDSNRDFSHYAGENYDVFYSDAQGAPDQNGAFLTIEATWTGSQTDGSMNVTGVELFIGGQRLLANSVLGYRLGSRCVGSACNANTRSAAVDGDLTFNTIPRMGATNPADPADRIRLTLGFPRPAGTSLTINPVAPVTRGGVLNLAWSNIGASTYTLGVTGGPGISAPIVLGTFSCCGAALPIPLDVPPGTYQLAVAAGAVVSPAVSVEILSNIPAPVLAPVPPAGPGGGLTFIWSPNGAPSYDLTVISGPGVLSFIELGPSPCCSRTVFVPPGTPAGTYQAVVFGNGVRSAPVSFQVLGGSGGLELRATSTIVRPGLQTTLSWTDRGASAGPVYNLYAGPAGAASLGLVATQTCCSLAVPWGTVPLGAYDVYVVDSNGLRSNRVTVRFDP